MVSLPRRARCLFRKSRFPRSVSVISTVLWLNEN
nr:MAG TPA: hypothetical protein [Herelleviridae sp.]